MGRLPFGDAGADPLGIPRPRRLQQLQLSSAIRRSFRPRAGRRIHVRAMPRNVRKQLMADARSSREGEHDAAAGPLRRWLWAFFQRRAPNRSDIDDLVQDVFVRLAARDSPEPVQNLGAYVVRTAVSVLADRSRRSRARRADLHVVFDPDEHGVEDFNPERVLSGRQELDLAVAALLSLPERTRNVFILRRLEGMRHGEIAARLGISVSAVEKHMVKAVQHLRSALESRVGS